MHRKSHQQAKITLNKRYIASHSSLQLLFQSECQLFSFKLEFQLSTTFKLGPLLHIFTAFRALSPIQETARTNHTKLPLSESTNSVFKRCQIGIDKSQKDKWCKDGSQENSVVTFESGEGRGCDCLMSPNTKHRGRTRTHR